MAAQNRSVFFIQARLEGLDQVVGGFDRMTSSAGRAGQRIETSAQKARREWEQMNTTFSRVYQGMERLSSARMEIGGIWRKGASDLRVYTDETRKLLREQEKFKTLGKSQADNERAFKAVRDTVGQIKGLRLDKTTADLTDLNTAFGDLDVAIQALPMFAKFRFGLESIFGEDVTKSRMDEMVSSGGKFLELIGKIKATGPIDPKTGLATFLERDRQEMEKYFSVLVKGSAATGGKVTMPHMLQMARRGKTSVQGLSTEGLATLMTLIPEMSAEGTGVAMMSLFQNMVAGKMPISSMNRMAELGMIDPKRVQLNKNKNKIIKLLPGAVKNSDLLMEDPLKFADEFAKVLATRGGEKGKGIDTTDVKKVSEEIAAIIRDRTAQSLLVALITRRDSILRQRKTLFDAEGPEDLYTHGLDTAEGKLKQFDNAVDNFRATVGGPLVTALTSAAQGAKPFLDFLSAHPTATLMAIAIGKVVSSVAQTAAVLKLAGVGEWFKRGTTALPTATLSGREQWDQLFSPSQARTSGVSTGKSAGLGIGAGLVGGIGIGLAVYGLTEVIGQHLKNKELQRQAEDAGIELGQMIRQGVDQDLSQLDEENARRVVAQQMVQQRQRGGQLKAGRLQFGRSGSETGGFWGAFGMAEPSDIIAALLTSTTGDIRPAGSGRPSARMGQLLSQIRANRPGFEPSADEGREMGKQLLTQMLQEQAIGSVEELRSFLERARADLEKTGAGELYGPLAQAVQQVYPQLFQAMNDQIRKQEELAQKYGYVSVQVGTLGDSAVKAAGYLNSIGGTDKDDNGQPIEKRKRGGIVMRPTRMLVGEAGPEWISPFHQTLDAIRGGGGGGNNITLHSPVNITVNGPVSETQIQEIRRQARSAVRAGGDEVIAVIERKLRLNEQIR